MVKEDCELFAVPTYDIYNTWNAKLFDGKDGDPMSLVSFTSGMLFSFKEANSQPSTEPVQRACQRWMTPKENIYKVNFDAAIAEQEGTHGIGLVIQNHKGEFIARLAKKFQETVSAETVAARGAFLFVKALLFPSFSIAGDAYSIIQKMLNREDDSSVTGPIVNDVRDNLNSFK